MFKTSTKFLIVDDALSMRKIIKRTLLEIGFTNSVEASDGVKAYDMLLAESETEEPIEFIISDWNMPNMTGMDFLTKCRANKLFEKIPFVMVTAENDQARIVQAVKAGVTDFVLKPFTPAMLKTKFETYYKKLQGTAGAKKAA